MKMVSLSCLNLAAIVLFLACLSFAQNLSRNKSYLCMTGCQCTKKNQKKQEPNGATPASTGFVGIKVKCEFSKFNLTNMSILKKNFTTTMPNNVIELDLSANQILGWEEDSFEGLDYLLKLDLSQNPISKLPQNAFKGLNSLRILDLSHTQISELWNGTFTGLQKLERLIFLETPIQRIREDALTELANISRLDIQSEMLTCDCHLKWFSTWLRSISIQEDILCGLPSELRNLRVSGLEPEGLHCDWPLELPHFELIPSTNQVVFQGDSLPITCQAKFFDPSMNFSWLHDGNSLDASIGRGSLDNVRVALSSERNMKIATLELLDVDESLSGVWTCQIGSRDAHVSKSLKIMVLSKTTVYCPPSTTHDNKGGYTWPSTLAGAVKALTCMFSIDHSGVEKAYRACNQDGSWSEPDTSRCHYVSEVTRMLGEAASLNLSLPDVTTGNVLKTFYSIGPQTKDGTGIEDHTEICFLARIVEQLSLHSKKFEKVAGEVVVGLVNLSMNVSPDVLLQAQLMNNCCSRILKALEKTIANLLASDPSHLNFTSRNVAVQGHKVTSKNEKGLSCGSESLKARNQTTNVSLVCEEVQSEMSDFEGSQDFESTIFIPPSTIRSSVDRFHDKKRFTNSINEDEDEAATAIIIIINLRDSRLFPTLEQKNGRGYGSSNSTTTTGLNHKASDGGDIEDVDVVSGPVLMANIVSIDQLFNSSSSSAAPVVLTVKSSAKRVTLTQAKWREFPNGRGKWTKGDCIQDANKMSENDDDYEDEDDECDDADAASDGDDNDDGTCTAGRDVTFKFSCQTLGAFAVAQKPSHLPVLVQLLRGLREVTVLIYIGCLVIFLVSSAIIFIYITHWTRLEMSPKARHAVVNLSLSLALLALSFSLGVKMYRLQIVCRISSILIHYFSMSTQVWITIINFKLLHKLIKSQQDETFDLEKQKPKTKPVAPDYLLGWGVPAIVCGIGSAINWDDQTGAGFSVESKICFLNKSATILMFFLPSAIVIFINFIVFVKVARLSRHGCIYSDDDEDADRQNSLECGTPPSMSSSSSSSSSYPHLSSHHHPELSHSDDTMVANNEDDDNQMFSKKLLDTDQRLLQLLNRSVVGVSSGNASSYVHETMEKSLVPVDSLESALTTEPQTTNDVEFDGFGSIYPPSSQLCGSAATLLLFCATWATGMLSIVTDPPKVFHEGFNGDFFRITFVTLSFALSSFLIVYFCFGRRDIRKAACSRCACWRRRHQGFAIASREEVWRLRDSIIEQNKSAAYPTFCQPEHSTASFEVELLGFGKKVEVDRSFGCNKICKRHDSCESPAKETDLPERCVGNKTDEEEAFPAAVKHSVVVDSRSSVVFYDPRQNGAAKRYWEKTRKKRVQSCKDHNVATGDDVQLNGVSSGNQDGHGYLRAPVVKQTVQKDSAQHRGTGFCPDQPASAGHLPANSFERKCFGNSNNINNATYPQCFVNNSIVADNVLPSRYGMKSGHDDDHENKGCEEMENWAVHNQNNSFHLGSAFDGQPTFNGTMYGQESGGGDDDDDEEEEEDVDDVVKCNGDATCHSHRLDCRLSDADVRSDPPNPGHRRHDHHYQYACDPCQGYQGNQSFNYFLPHCEQSNNINAINGQKYADQNFSDFCEGEMRCDCTKPESGHPRRRCGHACASQARDVWVKK